MSNASRPFGLDLPEYPWDAVAPYAERARQHPDGIVDLSVGTPVDPTPQLIQDALKAATDAHGYPTTAGRADLRQAIVDWFARRRGVPGLSVDQVLPTVGSKELVAWLPLLLGLRAGDVVVRPRVAYPTYDIGALLAGATPVAADSLGELDADTLARVRLVWLNSPGNPTGEVLSAEEMARIVRQARELGAVVASDECYAELGWGEWESGVPSVLDPEVSGGSTEGLLAVYSLSKQSNLAGYRAAFIAGDQALISSLLVSRKHAGMMVPWPVQEAMRVALADDAHVQLQKDRYRARRETLLAAMQDAGFVVHGSEAGLYLWVTPGGERAEEDSWATVAWFADRGILVGPGVFYGDAGQGLVRLALTASDERIEAAARRLRESSR
ncbi:succinyldiaminopimelate transaminase [Psychromicrobium xiongbiense]|uniref:succinyldiaminopimelate transaminase n=1 Tax=Psychromicrobium xiongbiense TaxID=3051184 RepID=UPI002556804E|nr:succinyldiaminopimelate transaminase [Psychromicrobium sp. YIM S02556]